jgi:DNA-binding NtrC family response regulator
MPDGPEDHRATLLVVEDEDQIRQLIRSMLAPLANIEILEAATGAEGLRIGSSVTPELDLLITDMLLPELSGYDLAAALREKFPRMKIIMMTGYVEGEIVMRGMEELGATFLDKPFKATELRRMVSNAIGVPNAQTAS